MTGNLLPSPGTMSGGGSRVMKGRMSSKLHTDISPQQLEGLECELERDDKALQVRHIPDGIVNILRLVLLAGTIVSGTMSIH